MRPFVTRVDGQPFPLTMQSQVPTVERQVSNAVLMLTAPWWRLTRGAR